jgi:thiamine biosynthesis lipoprotein ApbE
MEYNEASEGIIGEINACYSTDMSTESIRDMLSGKYVRDIEITPDTTTTKTDQQQLIFNELMRFNDNMESLIERLNKQDDLQRQINEQGMAIRELSRMDKHKKSIWSIFKLWG